MARTREQLVGQHLENVSRKLLAKYPHIVRDFARGRHGLYALYRKDRLYYVGLATNLRQRLKQHLRDQHAQTWDRFSLYLTVNERYLREIESLFLRISKPRGNTVTPGLARSENLVPVLRRTIKQSQRTELEEFAPDGRVKATRSRPKAAKPQKKPKGRQPTLARYVKRRFTIRFAYKGETHVASVRTDGTISYRGQVFTSPSSAAQAVTKRPMDGWHAWRYERAPGDWVPLDKLRR